MSRQGAQWDDYEQDKPHKAPVTHEPWTADFICHLPYFEIAEIHNASMTAEREDRTERMNSVQDFYSRQFTAERQKYVEQREDWIREIQQLREQLAAAQEAIRAHNDLPHDIGCRIALTDTTILDEYVEKECQPIIQGLHRLYALRDPTCQRQAEIAYETALAHWKEKNK